MKFEKAPDITHRLKQIARSLGFETKGIFGFRSYGSSARAYARIWGFPRIWQMALDQSPFYCLEVLAEKFDRLNSVQQDKVLIHELMHIPKNFSGALLPHRGRNRAIDGQAVEKLYQKLKK